MTHTAWVRQSPGGPGEDEAAGASLPPPPHLGVPLLSCTGAVGAVLFVCDASEEEEQEEQEAAKPALAARIVLLSPAGRVRRGVCDPST